MDRIKQINGCLSIALSRQGIAYFQQNAMSCHESILLNLDELREFQRTLVVLIQRCRQCNRKRCIEK